MKSTINSYFLVIPPFFCILYGPLYDLPTTEWQTKNLCSCNSNFTIATHINGPTKRRMFQLAQDRDSVAGMAFLMNDSIAWHVHSLTEVQEETRWTRSETEPYHFQQYD